MVRPARRASRWQVAGKLPASAPALVCPRTPSAGKPDVDRKCPSPRLSTQRPLTDTDIDRGSLAKGIGKATRSFTASGPLVSGSQVLRGFARRQARPARAPTATSSPATCVARKWLSAAVRPPAEAREPAHDYTHRDAAHHPTLLPIHDGSGVWCAGRRPNAGHFAWPREAAASPLSLTPAQFAALVVGLP